MQRQFLSISKHFFYYNEMHLSGFPAHQTVIKHREMQVSAWDACLIKRKCCWNISLYDIHFARQIQKPFSSLQILSFICVCVCISMYVFILRSYSHLIYQSFYHIHCPHPRQCWCIYVEILHEKWLLAYIYVGQITIKKKKHPRPSRLTQCIACIWKQWHDCLLTGLMIFTFS